MLLEDLQVVLKVAEFRSITAAAQNLDMLTSTASAAIKRAEKSLGTELFIRTTRQLRLSSAGERYIPQCEQAIQMLEQARQNIKVEQGAIEGEIRLALSSDLGRNIVMPWLDEFMETHPDITLRTDITDSNIDFYRDPVDMALRYGAPSESGVYGFKICDAPRLLCASKEYLSKHSTPAHPDDLKSHNGLFYQLYDIVHDAWEFSKTDKSYKIRMKGNRASNDGDLVRRWCVAGKGLAVKSCLDMSTDILNGNVVSIMQDYKATPTELWLVFPSRQSITPAARLLRDNLKEKCSNILTDLINAKVINKNQVT
ncbi:LysR family transcriptional regulator [Cocleimonas sp. KMM 6892]|uniref:LysR family transcriptional regulator n=1 Tax=unclassified Cocleimonas TaxID=2639732 RepID=UPI002DBEE088|nr:MULTISPECIES: LysR family transcriptional regulator [unclassified Cocleimonas]MEB8434294.1 LysR family transcriptional regulator [Cocleimonas sp. KMM 6892]MEC4717087.1 LysR family transcriptional regulator [Cocleimonas sp. KMM 6895]MEC4746566.1 LysR family transcriptional regulator [Cocleimonas sp. KMM 6896]